MSTAIVIYKGSSSNREAAANENYDVQSRGDSFDDILNSYAPQHKNTTKKKLRSEFVEGEEYQEDEEFDEESSS